MAPALLPLHLFRLGRRIHGSHVRSNRIDIRFLGVVGVLLYPWVCSCRLVLVRVQALCLCLFWVVPRGLRIRLHFPLLQLPTPEDSQVLRPRDSSRLSRLDFLLGS